MTSLELKAEIASYFRYERQCPIVCFEADNQDVIVVMPNGQEIWIEVKISISDLLADRRKQFHQHMCKRNGRPVFGKKNDSAFNQQYTEYFASLYARHMPARFYFAVPEYLEEKALAKVEKIYPWAGLLISNSFILRNFAGHTTAVKRDAEQLHKNKANIGRLTHLIRCQSGTLCRVSAKLAKLTAKPPKVVTYP